MFDMKTSHKTEYVVKRVDFENFNLPTKTFATQHMPYGTRKIFGFT